ncbi:MAG: hypothetical protein P8M50_01740 [Paracoccaceae bacterium]|nr:hypothetical protein [Paracoccaceae bacterium]
MINNDYVTQGVKNLLINCAELIAGDKLLIVSEKEYLGWYRDDASKSVRDVANSLGILAKIVEVDAPGNHELNEIESIIPNYDCTIFFARIGDQNRFEKLKSKSKRIMSYARSAKDLASLFSRINHQAMVALKDSINSIFLNSKNVEVLCPQGTYISGEMVNFKYYQNSDVTVLRFPMLVPMPIFASSFSGKVLLSNYLTSTGSQVYYPNSFKLSELLTVIISKGRITDVHGLENDVVNFNKHYDFVSKKFSLDKHIVHSWHAGIHPATKYEKRIDVDPDQWANTIFGNPHYLHFHTCGALPPGEICWMIQNPTIKVDNKNLWNVGVLMLEQFDETKKCLKKWSELNQIFG